MSIDTHPFCSAHQDEPRSKNMEISLSALKAEESQSICKSSML